MGALTLAQAASPLPPWHPHPDVWVLVAALAGGYLWAVYRIGPRVAGDPAVSPWQVASWMAGVAALWAVSDWPVHDLGEQSSFTFHTLEHLVQALVVPPLLLLGTPRWLAGEVLGVPGLRTLLRGLTRPVPAFLIFNVTMLAIHWPEVVGLMLASEPFHLGAHGVIVVAGLLMWTPVLSPHPDLPRLSPPLQMIYLFAQSILPTIPASFVTFASQPLYPFYEGFPSILGLSTLEDQQVSGLLMKIGGGVILWTAIAVIFFRWWGEEQRWDRIERELRRS